MSEKDRSSWQDNLPSSCSRREAAFVVTSLAAGTFITGCGASDALGSGTCMDTQPSGSVVAFGVEALAEGKVLRVAGTTKPINVARDGRGFMAIDATCTHQGCEAIYVESRNAYECGCHGSRFSLDGAVLMGPALKPLNHVFICRNSDGLLVVQPDSNVLSSGNGRIQ